MLGHAVDEQAGRRGADAQAVGQLADGGRPVLGELDGQLDLRRRRGLPVAELIEQPVRQGLADGAGGDGVRLGVQGPPEVGEGLEQLGDQTADGDGATDR